jgi:hypothetical protein
MASCIISADCQINDRMSVDVSSVGIDVRTIESPNAYFLRQTVDR